MMLGIGHLFYRDDPIVWNVGGELEEHQKPSVGIAECLNNLFSLPLIALDPSQVALDSDYCFSTLLRC